METEDLFFLSFPLFFFTYLVHPVLAYRSKCLQSLTRDQKDVININHTSSTSTNTSKTTTSSSSPHNKKVVNDNSHAEDAGIGSCSWINWWLPHQYSSGKGIQRKGREGGREGGEGGREVAHPFIRCCIYVES